MLAYRLLLTSPSTSSSSSSSSETNDQIAINQSTMQQLLDAKEQIKNLKLDLQNREARLFAIQELLTKVLGDAHINSSLLYKEINKSLTDLADLIDSSVTNVVNQQLGQLNTQLKQSPFEATMLSSKFRQREGLPPLSAIEEDQTPQPQTNNNKNPKSAKQ